MVGLASDDAFTEGRGVVQRGPECTFHPLEFGGSEDLECVGLCHSTGLHLNELGIAQVSLGHQVVEGALQPDSPGLILYCQDLLWHAEGRPGDVERTGPLAVPVYHALVVSTMDVKRA